MKIYRNNCVQEYNRIFFYLHGKCVEIHGATGKLHFRFAHYNRKDVIRDPEHFPVAGEIKENEIVDFILSKLTYGNTKENVPENKSCYNCGNPNCHIPLNSVRINVEEHHETYDWDMEFDCMNHDKWMPS